VSDLAHLLIPGRAQENFEAAVCEYRNCLVANPNNANACEGLRHSWTLVRKRRAILTVQDSGSVRRSVPTPGARKGATIIL
jgi:hypothetical protein